MPTPSISPQPDELNSSKASADQPSTLGETRAYDATAGGIPSVHSSSLDPLIGTSIGRYTLLKKLGEGGMGSVYLAEQSEPMKRQVALKLIRGNFDSRTILARFEAERQALAVMDHPNIARIYDGGRAGSVSDGHPYFIMELVQGIPITDYCDQHRLSPKQRLELFVPICQAVQHAHQKGIIHRDIKPSNVLVTEVDGKPVPKVIDFGVAKATEQPLTDQSLGDTGAIVGTPTYMSPEQADPESMDIDTRTDIYALGIMLYELLTGSTPIDAKQFKRGALLEVLRMVLEVEPPRPSTKLSTAEALPSIAADRNVEPKQLQAMLRGDIDWIVMKALEKDRNRRYETANGFAADVQRYLTGETVLAHPPSQWYRIRKFVRRNRNQVVAVGFVLAALLTGLAVSVWQMNRAIDAEGQAKFNEQKARDERDAKDMALKAEQLARKDAETNLGYAQEGNRILGSVFEGLNPNTEYKYVSDLRNAMRDNLHFAVRQLERSSIGDPLVVAAMQYNLGVSLLGLADYESAITLLSKCLDTRTERLGADHSTTLKSSSTLAVCYKAAGKLDKAIPLYEHTFRVRVAKLGKEHPDTLNSSSNLALGYMATGKLEKALPLFEETLKISKFKLGADHQETLNRMNSLAVGYWAAGKNDQALLLLEETLKLTRAKLGNDHSDTLNRMSNLAVLYSNAGKLHQALQLYEETYRLRKIKLGANHPTTILSMSNLAVFFLDTGNLDKAVPLLEESLLLRKNKLGNDHPDTLMSMSNLAKAYSEAGKLDLALPLLRESLQKRKDKLGPDHPDTLSSMMKLAMWYKNAGKLEQALPLLEETLKLRKKILGLDHPDTLVTMHNLAMYYKSVGNLEQALTLFSESFKLHKKKYGDDHPDTLITMSNLGSAYCAAQQKEKGLSVLTEYVAAQRKRSTNEDLNFAGTLATTSLILLKCDEFAAAEEMLRESLAIRESKEPTAWTTFNTHSMLGAALLGQKKYVEAEPLLIKGYEGMVSRLPQDPPGADAARLAHNKTLRAAMQTRIAEALDRLIQLYTETNKPDEVKKWQAEKEKISKTPEKK